MLAVLPTGFGKSLRYFALPQILDKIRRDNRPSIVIVHVVTPLTALMKDQVCMKHVS